MRLSRLTSSLALTAAAAVTCLSPAPASALPAPSSGCAEVEVVTVRGTGEPQGGGFLVGPLAESIQRSSARTVSITHLDYTASPVYPTSVPRGQAALVSHLEKQAAACPQQEFVVTGYSLGAWVVGNALTGEGRYSSGDAVSSAVGSRIDAVVLYGNPMFNSAEAYDRGTFRPGFEGSAGPRPLGALSAWAAGTRDYCQFGDTVCQAPTPIVVEHLNYNQYQDDATRFVVGITG